MVGYRPGGVEEALAWWWIALEAAVVFAACTTIFYVSLAALPGSMEGDTLFHYRMARLILERGPWVSIDGLPYTVLGAHGTDQNWLFHLIIAPLTLLGDSLVAIHLATAMAAAAVVAAFLVVLRRNRVPYAPLICLLMVTAGATVQYRFLLLRGQDFAVPIMVAILFAMLAKRRVWCGVGAFLFMQGYHAAVILGLFCVIVAGVQWHEERRIDVRTALSVFYGIVLGLVLSPWFPENVKYLLFHTVFKVAKAEHASFELIGHEWALLTWREIAVDSWPAHAIFAGALIAGAFLAVRGRLRFSRESIAFCGATLAFLAMYKEEGWRFVEYYAPFAVLTAGLIWRDAWLAAPKARAVRVGPAVVAAVCAAFALHDGVNRVSGWTHTVRLETWRPQMLYVMAHDPAPMVFNSAWWDYVVLFFHAPGAKYVAGLDGHFLKLGDSARFSLWNSIIHGERNDDPELASTIHDRFAARWAIIPHGELTLGRALSASPDARLAVQTLEGWLFELKGAGAAWPRPDSPEPGSAGTCAGGFGLRGSASPSIEVPMSSTCPDSKRNAIARTSDAAGGGR